MSLEAKTWEPREVTTYTVTLTWNKGGRYYCFRLEKPEMTDRCPDGINEVYIGEITKSLPKNWTCVVTKSHYDAVRIL